MGLSSVSTESQAVILSTRELVLCSPPVCRKRILKALANEVVLAVATHSKIMITEMMDQSSEKILKITAKLQDIP